MVWCDVLCLTARKMLADVKKVKDDQRNEEKLKKEVVALSLYKEKGDKIMLTCWKDIIKYVLPAAGDR